MATTPSIRNLQLSEGNQGAFFDLSNRQSQNIAEGTPAQNFSKLIMDLLTRHQQLGIRGAQEAQFAGQEEQIRRIGQTPQNLIGASPSIQAGVRSASVGALEPQISGARQAQQTFGEQIRSFGDILKSTQQLLRDEETRQQGFKEEMRSQILMAAQLGGSGGLESLLKSNPNAFKVAGLDSETLLASIKAREAEEKRRFDVKQREDGLTPAQINQTVNQIAGAFDNEPIVKNYNTALEGIQTLKSIGVETKSPADDIAFIYGFAKLMDPNSVVREGEYNTIQKYAQTWADTFGFKSKRIFSNTNFLSSDAKQKMLNAVQSKFNSIDTQYKNLRTEYQRQVDQARAGQPRQITEYTPPSFQEQGQTFEKGGATWRKNSNGTYTRIK